MYTLQQKPGSVQDDLLKQVYVQNSLLPRKMSITGIILFPLIASPMHQVQFYLMYLQEDHIQHIVATIASLKASHMWCFSKHELTQKCTQSVSKDKLLQLSYFWWLGSWSTLYRVHYSFQWNWPSMVWTDPLVIGRYWITYTLCESSPVRNMLPMNVNFNPFCITKRNSSSSSWKYSSITEVSHPYNRVKQRGRSTGAILVVFQDLLEDVLK